MENCDFGLNVAHPAHTIYYVIQGSCRSRLSLLCFIPVISGDDYLRFSKWRRSSSKSAAERLKVKCISRDSDHTGFNSGPLDTESAFSNKASASCSRKQSPRASILGSQFFNFGKLKRNRRQVLRELQAALIVWMRKTSPICCRGVFVLGVPRTGDPVTSLLQTSTLTIFERRRESGISP